MPLKKTANTGGKRGGKSGRTICSQCFAIFFRVFEAKIRKRLEVSKKVVRGRLGQTEFFKIESALKHYKYRGFKTFHVPKWRKVGHENYKPQKKRKKYKNHPLQLDLKYFHCPDVSVRALWAGAGFPRNHYKNSGFGPFGPL